MESFYITALGINIFVIPFEIPKKVHCVGYLLVSDLETLGSIRLGQNYLWMTDDKLPFDHKQVQIIGKEIERHFFLSEMK